MSRVPLVILMLAAALVLGPVRADAQQRPPDDDLARLQQERARAIKGWPGGIVFSCVVAPADLETPPVKQICTSAVAAAGAHATKAKVKFTPVTDQRGFATTILRERALGLTVQVSPSDFGAPVAALVIRVFASRPYSDLVSAAALKAPNPAQNPLATARAGDVLFWEELVVASGPPAQLPAGIAPAIDAKLNQFFADLAGAAPKR